MLGATARGRCCHEDGVRDRTTAHLAGVVGPVVEATKRLLHVVDVTLGGVEIGLLALLHPVEGSWPVSEVPDRSASRTYRSCVSLAELFLAEAEEQIEAWLCDLDGAWHRIVAEGEAEARGLVEEARSEAVVIVAQAHADANAILENAELRLELIAAARSEAAEIVAAAHAEANAILDKAEMESTSLLAGTGKLASILLAEAEAEASSVRALGRVHVDDLAGLGTAVLRLRSELSKVVDAAFDALPAVEAIASALDLDAPTAAPAIAPQPQPAPAPRRGMLRRLLRR